MAENSQQPRVCHLKKAYPEQEYGFNLHGSRGRKGQYIGSVDAGSPADLAGLKAGHKIVAVNGRSIGQDDHKQVVAKIRENSMECKLSVLSEDDSNNRKTSANSLTPPMITPTDDAKKLPVKNGDAVIEKNHIKQNLKPKLCVLNKTSPTDEYGFNLHAENGRTYYIGKVDRNSIAETAGLVEGQRIVGVNKTLIYPTTVHKDLVSLIKQNPSSVNILVASTEVDEYYKENSLSFNFDDVENDISNKNIIHTKQITENGYVNIQNGSIAKKVEERITPSINQLHLTKDSIDESKGGKVANGQARVPSVDETGDEQNKRKHKSSSSSVSSSSVENPVHRPQQQQHNNNNNNVSLSNGPNRNGSSGSTRSSNNGEDFFTITASEMRQRLKQNRKNDPRNEHISMEDKHQIINNL